MPSGKYDITADQGSTFKMFLEYQDSTGTAEDLSSHSAKMQVRKFISDTELILDLAEGSVFGGGNTGYFLSGSGITGSGGITLNGSENGAAGFTGGIYTEIDASTMANVPVGRHFYDIELTEGSEVTRILEGAFRVNGEVTR